MFHAQVKIIFRGVFRIQHCGNDDAPDDQQLFFHKILLYLLNASHWDSKVSSNKMPVPVWQFWTFLKRNLSSEFPAPSNCIKSSGNPALLWLVSYTPATLLRCDISCATTLFTCTLFTWTTASIPEYAMPASVSLLSVAFVRGALFLSFLFVNVFVFISWAYFAVYVLDIHLAV